MDAASLYAEITGIENPAQWACRSPTRWFEHACGRLRFHDGDHAEVLSDTYRAVVVWPNDETTPPETSRS